MWVEQTVYYQFAILVNHLVGFHESYGKIKNQALFDNIKDLCADVLKFLTVDKQPDGATVTIGGRIAAILTTLSEITRLKGNEDIKNYIKDQQLVEKALRDFLFFFKEMFKAIRPNSTSTTYEEISVKLDEKAEILPDNESKKEEDQEDDHEIKVSGIYIPTIEELQKEIAKIGVLPIRSFSLVSFFKSTAAHFPKTTGFGVTTLGIGIVYEGLGMFNHYVGPMISEAIRTGTGIALDSEHVIAGALVIAGVTASAVAVGRQLPSVQCNRQEVEEERRSLLSPV